MEPRSIFIKWLEKPRHAYQAHDHSTMNSLFSPRWKSFRQPARIAFVTALSLAFSAAVSAQAPDDETAVLGQVRGTVYAREIAGAGSAKNERRCGFDFLVIARDPVSGGAVQLKGRFSASMTAQGAVYGWSGVVYEGLKPGAVGHAPGRIDLQPVNGMRVAPKKPVGIADGNTLQYQERMDADFQVLMSSVVRDRGLKLGFSREPDGALIETTLDLDVSAMQLQDGRVTRQFDSAVPAQMGRCWSGAS